MMGVKIEGNTIIPHGDFAIRITEGEENIVANNWILVDWKFSWGPLVWLALKILKRKYRVMFSQSSARRTIK